MISIDWCNVGYEVRNGEYSYWAKHDYAGGVDLRIAYRNKGDKTIKYVDFKLQAINAVGDPVECEVRRSSIAEIRDTGPLAPNEIAGGGWKQWRALWYNPTIQEIRIINVKIEYMDGTFEEGLPTFTPQNEMGGCYVATCVYGSYDCPEVWTLRRYRDATLARSWYGRAFIHTYYAVSPTLVKWFGHTAWFKNMWHGTLDRIVNRLNARGVENTPYHDREW